MIKTHVFQLNSNQLCRLYMMEYAVFPDDKWDRYADLARNYHRNAKEQQEYEALGATTGHYSLKLINVEIINTASIANNFYNPITKIGGDDFDFIRREFEDQVVAHVKASRITTIEEEFFD